MNLQQTAKMTGIPEGTLLRMRSRESRSLKSGPPYHKTISKDGEAIYLYKKEEIRKWLKIRLCLITAGDAADIMGISRDEVLKIFGLKGFNVKNGKIKGRLIVDNGKNQYIWLPKV